MEWQGSKLKERLNVAGLTQAALAAKAGVTRQTVVDWINGQVPKGSHLLVICDALDIGPDDLFTEGPSPVQVAPLHRRRLNAAVTAAMPAEAQALAADHAALLEPGAKPVLEWVVRQTDEASALRLAARMRELAGLADGAEPLDYEHAFRLMEKLGVCVVFRRFPESIKDYAFYTVVNGHRVVFVNADTNLLDLIFPMLHEGVHAMRNLSPGTGWDQAEEVFCDRVAGLVQFPDAYVDDVCQAIKRRQAGTKVNVLKDYARRHHHVIYGVVRRMEERCRISLGLNVHGADANLRKEYSTLRQALLSDGPCRYVEALASLTPLWYRAILRHLGTMTNGRLCEVLDLESVLDAKLVREALEARRGWEELDGRTV